MDQNIEFPDTPFVLARHMAILGRRGSEAHGTFIPSTDPNSIDDHDLMGVVIPPARHIIGMGTWYHAESFKGPWDVVLYGWGKFIGLLTKQNPNVLGHLWLESEDYLYISPVGQNLIDNRDLFRCRKPAYDSFCGYATSQLKKMTSYTFEGYMGAKRKQIVERFGFDVKNGAHLIRLLHMGEEFQRTGELKVRRTWDRDMLLDIKTGKWSLQQVKNYAIERMNKMNEAYNNSVLPEELNMEAIEELVMEGHRTVL